MPKFPVEILLAGNARAMMPVADKAAATVHAEKRAAIVNPVRRAAEEGAFAARMTVDNCAAVTRPHRPQWHCRLRCS